MDDQPIKNSVTDEELLELSPFLRLLPVETGTEILSRMKHMEFGFGELIVGEGDAADSYYLITGGRARVLKHTESGKEVPLQRLRRGDSFGEIGLLSGGPRTATVRTSEPTSVYRLDREDFDNIIGRYPQLREFVQLQLQHRMLQGFLQQYTRFARTPLPVLQRILQFLKPVEFEKGEVIIQENDPGGSVYIIEQGRLTVYREIEGEKQVLAYLRPGDYFGELSLLQGMRRTASVEAASPCKLHRLAPEDWQAITDEYSDLEILIKDRISRYTANTGADRLPLDFAQTPENLRRTDDDDDDDIPVTNAGDPDKTSRFRFVQQIDDMDCGVAAFAMVCRYFGKDVRASWIRDKAGTGKTGTNAKDICRVSNDLGLKAEFVKKSVDSLTGLPMPAMLHLDQDHWVVLIEIRDGSLKVADPADKISWVPTADITARWTGHAILFEYTSQFRNAPVATGSPWSWVWKTVCAEKSSLALGTLLMLLVSLCEILLPVFTRKTVDEALVKLATYEAVTQASLLEGVRNLQGRTFILVLALAASLLLIVLQRMILSRASMRFDRSITERIFRRMLDLPLSYFLNRSTFDLQRRLVGARGVRDFVVNRGVVGLQAVTQTLVFLGVMTYYSPKMTLLFLMILVPIYAGLLYFSGKTLRPAFANLHETEASFGALQDEIIEGIQTIKSSGREENFRKIALQNFLSLNREQLQSHFNIFSFDGVVQTVWLIGSIVFLWIGSQMIVADQLSLGIFVAFLILIGMLYAPVTALVRLWADAQSATLLVSRLNDVLEWPPEQDAGNQALKAAPTLQGRVEFRDVTIRFAGPESEPALHAIDFKAFNGQLISIVGRSGSGKTVLAQALASLLPPTNGHVLYDGVESNEIRLCDLRRQIGYVPRTPRIFTGTIIANIAFGDEKPDEELVRSLARKVGINDQIEALPKGYDTMVWDHDHRLPNTLRQGIAIAQALYKDPAILVLDEVTAALDIETESTLIENLEDALRGRTVFVVTKSIPIAKGSDMILVLDRGRVVERGSHDDLMGRRGLYFHLASRQGK